LFFFKFCEALNSKCNKLRIDLFSNAETETIYCASIWNKIFKCNIVLRISNLLLAFKACYRFILAVIAKIILKCNVKALFLVDKCIYCIICAINQLLIILYINNNELKYYKYLKIKKKSCFQILKRFFRVRNLGKLWKVVRYFRISTK